MITKEQILSTVKSLLTIKKEQSISFDIVTLDGKQDINAFDIACTPDIMSTVYDAEFINQFTEDINYFLENIKGISYTQLIDYMFSCMAPTAIAINEFFGLAIHNVYKPYADHDVMDVSNVPAMSFETSIVNSIAWLFMRAREHSYRIDLQKIEASVCP